MLSTLPLFVCVCLLQHQQQVVQAVERAKQVTMAELNAVIGVRGLPGLPPTVCIPLLLLKSAVPACLCVLLYRVFESHISYRSDVLLQIENHVLLFACEQAE